MSRFAFAAAGTGGHVFPAVAVAAELVRGGVPRDDIFFVGGSRLEATAVPNAGFEFVEVPLQGLRRSLSLRNIKIPLVVAAAARRIRSELSRRGTRVMLATGGYVTVPAGWAARRAKVPLFLQEQNATPGLANRIAARWAARVFLGLPGASNQLEGEVTGNPLRREMIDFDRSALRARARTRYGVGSGLPVVGVVGGSLGAGVINNAVRDLAGRWLGPEIAIVHIAGPEHAASLEQAAAEAEVQWRVPSFEDEMSYFYAVSDLVVCRGGAVVASELAVTGTPALIVPRDLASSRHQDANTAELVSAGAAELVPESDLSELAARVRGLLEPGRLPAMAQAAAGRGRPDAALVIARAMREVADA